jgi:hypothetical protein
VLSIESEAFITGWRIVKNLDRQALARAVEGAGWNIFYLAGEMRAVVWGRERVRNLAQGSKVYSGETRRQKFDSLEITGIVVKRFLGVPFMRVAVHSRHIQRGFGLVPAKDFVLEWGPPRTQALGWRVVGAHHARPATKQCAALISSS